MIVFKPYFTSIFLMVILSTVSCTSEDPHPIFTQRYVLLNQSAVPVNVVLIDRASGLNLLNLDIFAGQEFLFHETKGGFALGEEDNFKGDSLIFTFNSEVNEKNIFKCEWEGQEVPFVFSSDNACSIWPQGIGKNALNSD